jgi:hypothetical protein
VSFALIAFYNIMNKKKILQIKKAMNYEGHPEQKRILKGIINGYNEIPHNKKAEYIKLVSETFNKDK